MGNKMLIDATHPEETRVVVVRGNRVEEFDYESAAKKQLRGNIYLAKVTRVEPSLQAAFVNYGGNRHGFLAFNEIHPDYYQLPMAERQALKNEEVRASREDADEDFAYGDAAEPKSNREEQPAFNAGANADIVLNEDDDDDDAVEEINATAALSAALPETRYSADLYSEETSDQDHSGPPEKISSVSTIDEDDDADDQSLSKITDLSDEADDELSAPDDDRHGNRDQANERDTVEMVGSEDALEELPQRNRRRRRTYKIQEVIKRGQIILVQVVKEERGNKGAALTTYLSLAGRYTVLMPNTGSGGGISRKISSPADRKRLREIANELDVPDGMGLIIRTAGAARTKTEVKRDYEYLLRLWENVRDLTLKSSAPALVYEEGDLIKRSIRDLYSREIDEVLVAGDDAYRDAKDFMRMLMPSHAKNVQPYKEPEPIFAKHEVERQLNAMFSPHVTLPSGGYIVINQAEALVAIDVNSGKATREFSIEDTALKTNLEAAEEIARQLRLRDLAGLIVVDFIDMEEKRNNRAVERKLKECLRNDRARIQVGRISHFGLLEMSRQRLRTGMVEGSTTQCPHCQGTGVIRSTESVALSVLRGLEDWLRTNPPCNLNALTSADVALYILNQKRDYVRDIELRYGVTLTVAASDRMQGANFYIEKLAVVAVATAMNAAVTQTDRMIQPFEEEAGETGDQQARHSSNSGTGTSSTAPRNKKRRRRRGRGGDEAGPRENRSVYADDEDQIETHGQRGADRDADDDLDTEKTGEDRPRLDADGEEGAPRRRSRRRGRRGGRSQRSNRLATDRDIASQDQPDYYTTVEAGGQMEEGVAKAAESSSAESAPPSSSSDAPDRAMRTEKPARIAAPVTVDAVAGSEMIAEAAGAAPDLQESQADTDTASFREAPEGKRRRGANGASKSNGKHYDEKHPEAAPAVGEQAAQQPEAAVEVAPLVAEPPKPRGEKRGWWQRKAESQSSSS